MPNPIKLTIFLLLIVFTTNNQASEKPALLLAKSYDQSQNILLENYWVSEKLDGVRAYWDGKNLISRQGNIFNAPKWFIRNLPNTSLDGELWIARQQFEVLSGIVRRKKPNDTDWKKIKYMLFDIPNSDQIFDKRLLKLKELVNKIDKPHIQVIPQFKLSSHDQLIEKLESITKNGAEGLMLHLGTSIYKSGRSSDILKVKKAYDAEAIVIAHLPGKGKFDNMLGALLVEMPNKKRFRIGTGFSDAIRRNPPNIGSQITYRYLGYTNKGIPKFASFMRIRKKH